MKERFTGPEGVRLLVDSLLKQSSVNGNNDIAARLATVAEVIVCQRGEVLIEQGGVDNHLNLIVAGSFSIVVNGREVARRTAGQHVGEMALIDPSSKRSATVAAVEESVVARISESQFSVIAREFPELWRKLACELGDRLRQRNKLVRQRNDRPRMFIGSSRESLSIANYIKAGLAQDPVTVDVWTNNVFVASEFSLESLEHVTEDADFATLVFAPDDQIISRETKENAPRDNVIFELGLFMGVLGRRRVYMVLPEGTKLKIPTDLLGLTPITYKSGEGSRLSVNLEPVCNELRRLIATLGAR